MVYNYKADEVEADISAVNSQLSALRDQNSALIIAVKPIPEGAWVGKGEQGFMADWDSLEQKIAALDDYLVQFVQALTNAASVAEQAVTDTGKIADSNSV